MKSIQYIVKIIFYLVRVKNAMRGTEKKTVKSIENYVKRIIDFELLMSP